MTAMDEIAQERKLQHGRWGNDHDDNQPDTTWATMLGAYVGKALFSVWTRWPKPTEEAQLRYIPEPDEMLRSHLIKVATICVAWVETIDRRRS